MSLQKIFENEYVREFKLDIIKRALKASKPDVKSPSTKKEIDKALKYIEELKRELT